MKIKLIYWDKTQCEEKVHLLKKPGHKVEAIFSQNNETWSVLLLAKRKNFITNGGNK